MGTLMTHLKNTFEVAIAMTHCQQLLFRAGVFFKSLTHQTGTMVVKTALFGMFFLGPSDVFYRKLN